MRKNTIRGNPIGTRSEALLRRSRQSLRQHILEDMDTHTMDTDKLVGKFNSSLKSHH